MLAGQPCINLDNLDAPLSSSLLCQALERPRVQVRLLGASQTPEVESRTLWFATGTNLRIVDDLTRRTLVAYLDSGLERPELREFEDNPLRRIVEDRGQYILACLTIVTAYAAAGMPGTLPPLASYGEWSDRIRSALVWLDAGDPCDSMPGVRENDPSFEARAAIYAAWPGTGEYTCADLVDSRRRPCRTAPGARPRRRRPKRARCAAAGILARQQCRPPLQRPKSHEGKDQSKASAIGGSKAWRGGT